MRLISCCLVFVSCIFMAVSAESVSVILGVAPNFASPGQTVQVQVKGVAFPENLVASLVHFGDGISVNSVSALRHSEENIEGATVTVDVFSAEVSIASSAALGRRVVSVGTAIGFLCSSFNVVASAGGGGGGGSTGGIVRFADAVAFAAPFAPEGITGADFIADNYTDLVVAAPGANSVLMYKGLPSGRFQIARKRRDDRSAPAYVAAADFNGDGKMDFVSANPNQPSLEIWIGISGFSFKPPSHISLPAATSAINLGDFNADSRKDVIAVSRDVEQAFLLLGNGDGTLQLPKTYNVGFTPKSVAVGDLNQDGMDDAVVGNFGNGISILKGDRTSGLTPGLRKNAPTAIENVVVADLNADGFADVATIGGDSILIYKGKGTGDFAVPPRRIRLANFVWNLVAADLNSDAIPDLAFVNRASGQFSVLTGKGNLGYDNPLGFPCGDQPIGMLTGDFNKDLRTDLVITNNGQPSTLSLFLNQTNP